MDGYMDKQFKLTHPQFQLISFLDVYFTAVYKLFTEI